MTTAPLVTLTTLSAKPASAILSGPREQLAKKTEAAFARKTSRVSNATNVNQRGKLNRCIFSYVELIFSLLEQGLFLPNFWEAT